MDRLETLQQQVSRQRDKQKRRRWRRDLPQRTARVQRADGTWREVKFFSTGID